ncbi:MBL fold metallo-hydrolase [Clostridium kluyveri]|uniref:Hydrolase n=1 Tax=Clostridium kluyveri TaxID=1534 RepID=A0A1L5FAT0_CLOKL|nr:MBL fold metallo-hydrolase [Clostridium kluyveri]APM40114.1 hydrolase [Clostridium kluyveri]UZQ49647.1 MBL fold metallo-hydrolase [Clostridium kluyveri]
MRIITLIENSLGDNKNLICEHGLSFFIQSSAFNILFDTGKSENFIKNAHSMNIDLNKTNYIIISHAHYDHGNGLKSFTKSFTIRPKIILSKYFFSNGKKYYYSENSAKNDEKLQYIGVNFDEKFLKENSFKVQYITLDKTEIEKGIYVFTNFKSYYDFEKSNPNMKVKTNKSFETDTFKDEICIGIDTPKGLLILLGCSHPGILNMIKSIEFKSNKNIFGILGGTHLMEASENRIEKTIVEFKKMNIKILGPSHCTGTSAYSQLKNSCDNFFVNSTGSSLSIP